MIYLSTSALILLLIGIFTSKELIEVGQLLFFISSLKIIYDAFKQKQLALPKSAYWLIAFILIALISILVNDDVIPRASINRAKLKQPLFGVLGIYFFRYWIKESSDVIKKWTLNFFLASVCISAVHGIFTYFVDNQQRMNGLIYTSKYAYASSFFLILLFTILLHREKFKNILFLPLAYIAFFLNFVAMTLTFSRAPMFCFLCAIPIALYFVRKKMAVMMGLVALILSLTAVSYYFLGKQNTEMRFLITKQNISDFQRVSVWQSAVIAIKERPITGWGYSNFKTQMERIKNQYDLGEKNFVDSHSHNNLLEVAAGTGLIGLFIFCGWLVSWIFETFKNPNLRPFLVPFGAVFLVTGQVEVTIIDSHLAVFIYLVYSLGSSYSKKIGDTAY